MVSSVAYSPDGKTISSGSSDKIIRLWDAETRTLLKTLEGHTDKINSIAYIPDGKTIVSGGDDTSIKLWTTNLPPTAMGLSNSKVAENSAAGTVVGLFTARDWNFYDKHFTYTVSGADASFFKVKGDELQIAQSPDYETKKRLKIRAKVTDEG